MATKPFARFIVLGPGYTWWWKTGVPYLEKKAWTVTPAGNFRYETSYGFEPSVVRNSEEIKDLDYCLANGSYVLEYRAANVEDSIFDPNRGANFLDDLLAYLGLSSGEYCQTLWRETAWRKTENSNIEWRATTQMKIGTKSDADEWAVPRNKFIRHFETALQTIPKLPRTQFDLAVRWIYSAQREYYIGRPIVEAALYWVALECQANYLNPGSNSGFNNVRDMLGAQGFNPIPRLGSMYGLRNNAFHQGELATLSESDAQDLRIGLRYLARAQILSLLGCDHADFHRQFTDTFYAP